MTRSPAAAKSPAGPTEQPMGRRERQRQRIRSAILDAALELFAEQGYAATTIDQIAERADLARRTVFNHFPRKRDMLDAWRVERRDLVAARLVDGGVRRAPARRRLELQMEALAKVNEENPRMARVLSLGWLSELGTLESPFPVFDSFLDSVRLGQENGDFRPSVAPETVAEILSAVYTETLHRWLQAQQHTDQPFPLGPALRAKLDLLLDGLTAPQG
ncbi:MULTISPECIES: TetR/AcrR family transcriptional regulator [Streptomyces]|uniref:TetR/AcrR family transcriptional regulator n=1 Tax=Streptomyces TaxID=1883 RepID=UPI001F0F12FD|nr:TetR/AcrR family transcriptional regulator [Streptomyces sp. Z423-1]